MDKKRKMHRSQQAARSWLEGKGHKVWFIHHTRRQSDIWGLWDGISIDRGSHVHFLQVKSNAWPAEGPCRGFKRAYRKAGIMLFNVKDGDRGRQRKVEARRI